MPYKYLDSRGMEPEVVAEHEEQAQDEGEVVAGQGRQDVPFKEKLNHRINGEGYYHVVDGVWKNQTRMMAVFSRKENP